MNPSNVDAKVTEDDIRAEKILKKLKTLPGFFNDLKNLLDSNGDKKEVTYYTVQAYNYGLLSIKVIPTGFYITFEFGNNVVCITEKESERIVALYNTPN